MFMQMKVDRPKHVVVYIGLSCQLDVLPSSFLIKLSFHYLITALVTIATSKK